MWPEEVSGSGGSGEGGGEEAGGAHADAAAPWAQADHRLVGCHAYSVTVIENRQPSRDEPEREVVARERI